MSFSEQALLVLGIPLQKKEASNSKPQQREVKNAKVTVSVLAFPSVSHTLQP